MKIYNGNKIIPGLVIFIGLITAPFWLARGRAVPGPDPSLNTPVIKEMAVKQCILPLEQMRTEHMQLLNTWRTEVVRDGMRLYVAPDGKDYPMSLQNECMKCHSNKKEFCDRCHTYAGMEPGVTPYCWQCHIAPEENK